MQQATKSPETTAGMQAHDAHPTFDCKKFIAKGLFKHYLCSEEDRLAVEQGLDHCRTQDPPLDPMIYLEHKCPRGYAHLLDEWQHKQKRQEKRDAHAKARTPKDSHFKTHRKDLSTDFKLPNEQEGYMEATAFYKSSDTEHYRTEILQRKLAEEAKHDMVKHLPYSEPNYPDMPIARAGALGTSQAAHTSHGRSCSQ